MTSESETTQSRRAFIKGAALASTGVALGSTLLGQDAEAQTARPARSGHATMMGHVAPRLENVRVGLIGTGARGTRHLRSLLRLAGVDVIAICDTDPISLDNAKKVFSQAGIAGPVNFTGNDYAYRDMLEREDIDAVIISTPWRWHAPMSIDAMNAGKHAFVEVPMATTIEDMWEMVEVSERTRMNCMMMENVCYGRDEMMVFNMVRHGLFGQLTHGEGAYIHELRWQMEQTERGTGSWRTHYHTNQKGNIYPTHGLGPIAQYMDINRGDRFDYMTSLSSPALGRAAFAQREFPADHERNALEYVNGDMNSTLIKTVMGRSILVQHDTTTARPYSRLNLVQGTGGAFAGFPNRIAVDLAAVSGIVPEEIRAEYQRQFENYDNRVAEWIRDGREGRRPSKDNFHDWDTGMDKWRKYFDHPLWKNMEKVAVEAGGHGGMDFIMLWRMVSCLQNGIALDQNVYDGAAWSSLFPLSHESVTHRSKSLDIPDFTRGAWKTAKSLDIAV